MKAAALAVVLLLVTAACAEGPVDAFIAQAEASAAAGEFGCLHDGTGNFECDEGVVGQTTTTTATSAPSGTREFLNMMETFTGQTKEWNDNQLEWVVAFQDPNVSLAEFLTVQQAVLTAQGSLVARMAFEVNQLPQDLREPFQPILDHYSGRLDLLGRLAKAATSGTDQQFQTALVNYQTFTQEGLAAMESLLTHPKAEAVFASQGGSGQQIVDAFRQAFGLNG